MLINPGVGLKIIGHQCSHYFNSQVCVCKTCATSTSKGYQMYFCLDKGVEGVAFTRLFQYIPIHFLILSSCALLKGFILTIAHRNFCSTIDGKVFA